jgi:amino acid adenylation domain-containing protein
VVSGRPTELPGVEEMIGLFITILPVRAEVDPGAVLAPWLGELQRVQVEAGRFPYVSAPQLQRWSDLPPGARLFDTVLVFENFPLAQAARDGAGPAPDEPLYLGRTDVALTVVVVPGDTLRLKLLYDQRRFDPPTVERMAGHLATLLAQLPHAPDARLGTLSLLAPEERHRVLAQWQGLAAAGHDRAPLAALLDERAARTPGAAAFVEGGRVTTVREVHERSNRLAHALVAEGVGPGTVVGVCLERSTDAAVALLAVLKARGVYLPLDPGYPAARLEYMATDSGAALVLACDGAVAAGEGARVLNPAAAEAAFAPCGGAAPGPHAAPGDLAYLLYTSGSTGRPKGVAAEHAQVLNRLGWMWRRYPFAPGEAGVVRTPLSFVDSLWEMLGPLLCGVPSVIAPDGAARDPHAFVELLAAHRVTRLWFVPSFLEVLLEACPDLGRRLPALTLWFSGGEPLSPALYRRFRAAAPGARLLNVYGASELWDATVFDPADDGEPGDDAVPIGRPIDNVEAYVLGPNRQPVPVGVAGELCFGGACLARGYAGAAAQAPGGFIAHPFRDHAGARLYATGDLARWRPDGVLEHLGRRDEQVSLRGFRVEPAEVEAALDEHPAVRESVVAVHDVAPGDRRLVAYAVAADDGPCDAQTLLEHLRGRLPAFMVPAAVVWIDAIPRTPSGKRDRRRLPAPELGGTAMRAAEAAPRTELEHTLAAHFRDVLGVERVGVHDHFFADLGGHSLLAARLAARLQDALAVEVLVRAVFDAPTVARLAAALAPRLDASGEDDAALLAGLAALDPGEAEALLAALGEAEGGAP